MARRLVAVFLVACADPAAVAPPNSPPSPEATEIERLGALGYTGFTAAPAKPEQRGVTVYDEQRAAPGTNLWVNTSLCSAELAGMRGEVLRRWHHEDCSHWAKARLLAAGDLVVVAFQKRKRAGPPVLGFDRALLRFRSDGTLAWSKTLPVHHDVEVAPDGRVFVLTLRPRVVGTRAQVEDNLVLELDAAGETKATVSLYEAVAKSAPELLPNRPRHNRVLHPDDVLHANTLHFVPAGGFAAVPGFSGGLLVTFRHRNTVALLEWSSRRIVWSYGQGELEGPHDAQLVAPDVLLVFDNGVKRKASRVLELAPTRKAILWSYPTSPSSPPFFTVTRGTVQRLANGNTLITVSDDGHAFEVTRAGELVWELFNPHFDAQGRRSTFEQVRRYPLSSAAKSSASSPPSLPGARDP
jgi:hypothetical protein